VPLPSNPATYRLVSGLAAGAVLAAAWGWTTQLNAAAAAAHPLLVALAGLAAGVCLGLLASLSGSFPRTRALVSWYGIPGALLACGFAASQASPAVTDGAMISLLGIALLVGVGARFATSAALGPVEVFLPPVEIDPEFAAACYNVVQRAPEPTPVAEEIAAIPLRRSPKPGAVAELAEAPEGADERRPRASGERRP